MPIAPYNPSLDHVRSAIGDYSAETVAIGTQTRQAAVAIILRCHPEHGHTQMLFIKRADKVGDPWSGHMAFPGGHREPDDHTLTAAASRETMEEIGLDLASHATYLGAVDQQRAAPRGRTLDMLIAPEVFELHNTPELALNYEVAEVVWSDLAALLDNRYHDTMTYDLAGTPTIFNGYRLPTGHFVWGLTYRMLKSFFGIVYPDWRAADVIESDD
ncbi:MAG: CoA pyrophosphatase [Pseudomonadales bacterium]